MGTPNKGRDLSGKEGDLFKNPPKIFYPGPQEKKVDTPFLKRSKVGDTPKFPGEKKGWVLPRRS